MSIKTIILCTASALGGIALVLSCSDDAPSTVDAAICDCPEAEPPLADRIMTVTQQGTVAANDSSGVDATCPAGAVLLSGGCETTDAVADDIDLRLSAHAPSSEQWTCGYANHSAAEITVTASATCLLPAQ